MLYIKYEFGVLNSAALHCSLQTFFIRWRPPFNQTENCFVRTIFLCRVHHSTLKQVPLPLPPSSRSHVLHLVVFVSFVSTRSWIVYTFSRDASQKFFTWDDSLPTASLRKRRGRPEIRTLDPWSSKLLC